MYVLCITTDSQVIRNIPIVVVQFTTSATIAAKITRVGLLPENSMC
jgi:hypothetical protein